MRKSVTTLAIAGTIAALALTACSSSGSDDTSNPGSGSSASSSGGSGAADGKGTKVGIILPDTQSSQRWVTGDPEALKSGCEASNLDCDIQNANGDAANMKTIASSMLADGVKILMIVNLDSASGAAIEADAKSKGVTTIDYDRLTLGGSAAAYISFDNVKVGELQGQALTQCSQVQGKSAVKYVDINGSPTDNNATLFKQGYDSVLSKTSGWTKVADQSIADWDNTTAGTTFASILQANQDINAVMVANDGMANSVIGQLKTQGLNGKVAVSGQDATAQGLQHILDGDQCFSIYKPYKLEADAAIKAMVEIANGNAPTTTGTVKDTQTNQDVPAILETPITITKDNVGDPIKGGDVAKDEVCSGAYAAKCTAAGIS
ncbi:sugar ABC transporter substrate-binding protein [Jatrophihabitans sp. YIM 134969]